MPDAHPDLQAAQGLISCKVAICKNGDVDIQSNESWPGLSQALGMPALHAEVSTSIETLHAPSQIPGRRTSMACPSV